jgi:hypothetical protein
MKARQNPVTVLVLILSLPLLGCNAGQYLAQVLITPVPTNTRVPITTPLPTDTPLPTATPLPTDTPMPAEATLPAGTPLPAGTTPASIPNCPQGWNRLEGRRVDMCLPASWEGGSDEKLDLAIATLRTMGAAGVQQASVLETTRAATIFWAFDTQVAAVTTNVNIGNESASMPVNQLMEEECRQIPIYYQQQVGGTASCLETGLVSIGSHTDVGKVVIVETISGTTMQAVQYILTQENTFWEVTFTTDPARYADSLPIFDSAISSLHISPP